MKRALLTLAFLLGLAAPASAAPFIVNTPADAGSCVREQPCSLRGALARSGGTNEADTITVPAGSYLLSPTNGPLTINGQVTINGAGANQTTIDGADATRVFNVQGQENRLVGLTITRGRALGDTGGNLVIGHGADLELDHVRVTRGLASRGGGIAAEGGGSLIIRHSLIDGNEARTNGSFTGEGGGIFVTADNPQSLEVYDTTIASNLASRGGGLMLRDQPSNETTLQRVTIADNTATGAPGGGLTINDLEFVLIEDSIIARNRGNVGTVASQMGPSNCGNIVPTSGGGNVESGTDCGLERQNTTGGLAAALADNGGQTPTLALPWTSDVHDFAGACTGATDQRDVARPAGACDPGAFEAQPPPPPVAEPTAIPTTVPTPTPTPTVTAAPTPVVNRTIVVAPARGTILVKLPGAKVFTKLDITRGIPVGSTVDARKGRVTLTAIPKPGAPPETATFYAGLFRVTQSRGITNLTLVEALARCLKQGRAASAAARKKSRKLWGDGKGSFRTTGKYSAATVRGTKWLVQDSCAGTLTRVTQGSVTVRRASGGPSKVVRAGKRLLVRPSR